MRIAVNTRFLIKGQLEGIGRYTHEICKRMVENHPNDEFHFFFDRAYDESFLYGPNVKAHVLLPPARHPYLWKIWYEWAVRRKLKSIKADVFYSPDGYLSLKADTPTVLVIHDLAFKHFPEHLSKSIARYYNQNTPKFATAADKIITVSNASKNDIISSYDVKKEKVAIVFNGISPDQYLASFDRNALKEKYAFISPFFLYLGAIHPRKNVVRILKAFEKFKLENNSDHKLIIAGRKAWKSKEFENTLQSMQYESDVKLLGFIPDDMLKELMAIASALVYVSLFEGFGVPIILALAHKTPVICSNRSSMPEAAGGFAKEVNPERIEEIAEAMKYYADENNRLKDPNAIDTHLASFNWDLSADQTYHILNSYTK